MAASNDRIVDFTQQENEWLQSVSLDMLRTSSSLNSPEQRSVIESIRSKIENSWGANQDPMPIVLTQQERSLLEVLIRDMYAASPRRNPPIQQYLIAGILTKLQA